MMTYEEVIAFGLAHYSDGGDSVVECLSREDYEEEVAEGYIFNKTNLMKRFSIFNEVWKEQYNMSNW